ncbi:uncharacterized protein LOC103118876 isoform X1 [Erinaceus europaeus]|uniref:Uncharacterized protein LOC103118876 isoform X1 n=1 Tax=Erinaceus europaeus TaxID=9365 RepID=A0ABM3WK57_ERIEU|nr:uncharacterized protein LOC103118876 isoform X1 [Erinaceus europaeus]
MVLTQVLAVSLSSKFLSAAGLAQVGKVAGLSSLGNAVASRVAVSSALSTLGPMLGSLQGSILLVSPVAAKVAAAAVGGGEWLFPDSGTWVQTCGGCAGHPRDPGCYGFHHGGHRRLLHRSQDDVCSCHRQRGWSGLRKPGGNPPVYGSSWTRLDLQSHTGLCWCPGGCHPCLVPEMAPAEKRGSPAYIPPPTSRDWSPMGDHVSNTVPQKKQAIKSHFHDFLSSLSSLSGRGGYLFFIEHVSSAGCALRWGEWPGASCADPEYLVSPLGLCLIKTQRQNVVLLQSSGPNVLKNLLEASFRRDGLRPEHQKFCSRHFSPPTPPAGAGAQTGHWAPGDKGPLPRKCVRGPVAGQG